MITEKNVAAASYTGGLVSVVSALTMTEWGILVGILTALGTFAVNVWFRYKEHRRAELEHSLRIKLMQDQIREGV